MTAPARLALDGGPPCLATTTVARFPAGAADDGYLGLSPLVDVFPRLPGNTVRRLERRWGDLIGREHVVACRSTLAAARLMAASLEIGPGDEVICPIDAPATAIALTAAVEAVPVFVDLDPGTLHLDPQAVEAAITERTRVVLAVDRHGAAADYHALDVLARRFGLVIVEDGSASLGASLHHVPVGALGHAGFCRLPPEGGAASAAGALFGTDDAEAAANARRILLVHDDFGLQQPLFGLGPRGASSYRMSELDAAAAEAHLNRLDQEVAIRRLNGRHLACRLSELAGIWTPALVPGVRPVYSTFPLLVQPDELGLPETAATALRDTLIDCTTAEGLWMDRAQPAPLSSDSDEARHRAAGGTGFNGFGRIAGPRRADFPVADAMWASGLVLGGGRDLRRPSPSAMDRIADCFAKILVDNVDRLRQLTMERMRVTP